MSKQSHPDFLLQLILRAHLMESAEDRTDRGFVIVITTALTVMIFSLLGAYLILTDISKTTTSVYVDSNNTFVTAESGMNIRASGFKKIFEGYGKPKGDVPKMFVSSSLSNDLTPITTTEGGNTYTQLRPTNAQIMQIMQQCIQGSASNKGSDDFKCRGDRDAVYTAPGASPSAAVLDANDNSRYNAQSQWKDIQNTNAEERKRLSQYTAYSFVLDRTRYKNGAQPQLELITSDSPYRGLLAQTYQYTVYSSGVDNNSPINTTNTNTVLQMDFKTRVVPLFQFGAFYDGDLAISGWSDFNVYGRVHTNKTLIIDPNGDNKNITFVGPQNTGTDAETTLQHGITAAGDIYTKDDTDGPDSGNYLNQIRITMPLSSGASPTTSGSVSSPDIAILIEKLIL
jgi:hypothetical protein